MNETLKVLKERRSVRKYKAEQIRDEELNAILEAGTWAPSAKGLQCCFANKLRKIFIQSAKKKRRLKGF